MFAPVSTTVGSCVAAFVASKGYETALCGALDTNTPTGCKSCHALINVTNADCVAAHTSCL